MMCGCARAASIQLGGQGSIPIDRTGAMLIDWKTPYARAGFDDFLLSVEQIESGTRFRGPGGDSPRQAGPPGTHG